MELLTQVETEQRMYYGGIKRAEGMMTKAEEKGRAVNNPYAKEILDEYVLPLAKAIQIELDAKRAGPRQAHAALLKGFDTESVAFIAVRTALNTIMMEGAPTLHAVIAAVGTSIHNELVLAQVEDFNPELYHTLANDFSRRLSKDERHRVKVMRMQAEKAGLLLTQWPVGARQQVGMYVLGLLQGAGMVEISGVSMSKGKQAPRHVTLAPEIVERIGQIKSYVAITMPVYGPCVEPPKDWITPSDGGFHTRELRRTHPTLVRHRLARTSLYQEARMPIVLEAANVLQRTQWQVNTRMLDTVLEVAKYVSVGEVTSLADIPKPAVLPWLAEAEEKWGPREGWPEDKLAEMKLWKRQMAEWYTQRKLTATRYGRFYSATRAAQMFREYPSIYFVYFADSRGRLYPMTYGLNPQGSDLQKALIRFSKGMPVNTPDAIKWFHVHGANKWGFDKAPLEERHAWVTERQELLLSFAEDPISNMGWRDADKPLQFLAWCFEYAAWVQDTDGSFVSHIPISMDGSCNGLQNLSALLRDEIGGEATNLTNNAVMQDIYRRVADAAYRRLIASPFEDTEKERLRLLWVQHGINRGAVKRSVMTTPYGVTKRSAVDYVISDYLKEGKAECFDKRDYLKAAGVLMEFVWPAIGDVVVKGRKAMDWLQRSSRLILKDLDPENPVITWVSPSGFPASQAYYKVQEHRITTRLHGVVRLVVQSERDEPDPNRHSNGLAPNFVHSMDAAHLHLATSHAARRLIDQLAMIHDDYGTHAANAQALYEVIRQTFVEMYENHDPIEDFKKKYPSIPAPPTKGSLDIREVLQSRYFFS